MRTMLSTDGAVLLTEGFSFHLVMTCKRRVQDTEWYLSYFQDLTTKKHSWTQKVWHWKDTIDACSFPLISKRLIHSLTSRTIFCFFRPITLECKERDRGERAELKKGRVIIRSIEIVLIVWHALLSTHLILFSQKPIEEGIGVILLFCK